MENTSTSNTPSSASLCPTCHQAISPEFYFCPNCGKNLKEKPVSTSVTAQLWLYAVAIVLPMILFLTISSWPILKYLKSTNPKARWIGIIALALLIISTTFVVWTTYTTTKKIADSFNTTLGTMGQGFGAF